MDKPSIKMLKILSEKIEKLFENKANIENIKIEDIAFNFYEFLNRCKKEQISIDTFDSKLIELINKGFINVVKNEKGESMFKISIKGYLYYKYYIFSKKVLSAIENYE